VVGGGREVALRRAGLGGGIGVGEGWNDEEKDSARSIRVAIAAASSKEVTWWARSWERSLG
jgi:hypothetical protein